MEIQRKSSHNVYLYFPRAGITSVYHTPSRYRKLPLEQDLNNSRKRTLRINVFLWKVNAYTHTAKKTISIVKRWTTKLKHFCPLHIRQRIQHTYKHTYLEKKIKHTHKKNKIKTNQSINKWYDEVNR